MILCPAGLGCGCGYCVPKILLIIYFVSHERISGIVALVDDFVVVIYVSIISNIVQAIMNEQGNSGENGSHHT